MSLPESADSVVGLASYTKLRTVAFILLQSAPVTSFLDSL